MNIKARLSHRGINEPLEFGYWQDSLELEQGRKLTLSEIDDLLTVCLATAIDEADAFWMELYNEVN